MAFVAGSTSVPDDVRFVRLASEPMALICGPEHPLARRKRVDWRTLSEETFVDFTTDWGSRQVTDRAFAAAGVARHIASEVNDVHTLLDLVGHGLGVAVVPEHIARKKAGKLACLPLPRTRPAGTSPSPCRPPPPPPPARRSWPRSASGSAPEGRGRPPHLGLSRVRPEMGERRPIAVPASAGPDQARCPSVDEIVRSRRVLRLNRSELSCFSRVRIHAERPDWELSSRSGGASGMSRVGHGDELFELVPSSNDLEL